MFNKALLMCGENEQPPEPGYIKAKLTIGDNPYWVGYIRDQFGSLEPPLSYYNLYWWKAQNTTRSDRPFYYKGVKYNSPYLSADDPVKQWKAGQVVEVWIATDDAAPETGYIKGELTIGIGSNGNVDYVGRLRNFDIGSIVPDSYDIICIKGDATVSLDREWSVFSSVPFYYNDVKYTNGMALSQSSLIYKAWTGMIGDTVTVWLAPQ